jgi:hypothetical protein
MRIGKYESPGRAQYDVQPLDRHQAPDGLAAGHSGDYDKEPERFVSGASANRGLILRDRAKSSIGRATAATPALPKPARQRAVPLGPQPGGRSGERGTHPPAPPRGHQSFLSCRPGYHSGRRAFRPDCGPAITRCIVAIPRRVRCRRKKFSREVRCRARPSQLGMENPSSC